ncbi:MAG: DUF2161 family putative PD-(D/E)XK-type phosphodiesterase [Clostridiaceae bacterium]
MKECDLYLPIKNYLVENEYVVKGEVKSCDIAAIRGDELIIIELKKSLNMNLIIQGTLRQKIAESVYIAIPHPKESINSKKWKDIIYLLKRLELGLITVPFIDGQPMEGRINIILHPKFNDRRKTINRNKKKKLAIIKEINNRNMDTKGGVTRVKILTAYRETSIYIACCLLHYNSLSPKQLKEIGTGDKTSSILNKNYYNWFDKVERGIYKLSETGINEIDNFPEVTKYYNNLLNKNKTPIK